MIRTIVRSLIVVVIATIVFGGIYPLAVTGIAKVAFSHEANGSLIKRNGVVVGSELDGQAFAKPQYFHSRPSATSPAYNPEYSTFANLGPTSSALSDQVKKELATVLKTERPYNPGLTASRGAGRRGDDLRLGPRSPTSPRPTRSFRRPGSPPCGTCRWRASCSSSTPTPTGAASASSASPA